MSIDWECRQVGGLVGSAFVRRKAASDSLSYRHHCGNDIMTEEIVSRVYHGTALPNATDTPPTLGGGGHWEDVLMLVLKSLAMFSVIFCAVFGNLLVISSVCRHHKLRTTTNYFIVSLAFADTLVALFAMTFNASVTISGRWMFSQTVCDFWNSCDVLFSTASIMHLCCISVDRYYAIMKPLEYPTKITEKAVAVMLACVWVSSGLISFIPIFMGWYTTELHIRSVQINPQTCEFVVNQPYCIISSSISFWIPCFIMVFTYWKIYCEATRQEKMLYKAQMGPEPIHSNGRHNSDPNSHGDDSESGHSTPTKRSISKMKREHKAAKTLGIIMGCFILCWLPFFLWYVSITMCGEACNCPDIVVSIVFWIGYFNSSLNPVIYAYFNREFREAFRETLHFVFCKCCCRLRSHEGTDEWSHHTRTTDFSMMENKGSRP